MKAPSLLIASWALLLALCWPDSSYAQVTCIQQYAKASRVASSGIAPTDIEALVAEAANAFGLGSDGIKVVPCSGVHEVQSAYLDEADVPRGDYILYDPIWVRQMLGTDFKKKKGTRERDQAVFLFGHEMGHLFDRHFTTNKMLPRLQQETAADRFAGCAAGALGASWSNITNFVGRIRGDVDGTYPSRLNSLKVVQPAFERCRVRNQLIEPNVQYRIVGDGPVFQYPKMNGRTLDGCLVSTAHPNGDDCSAHGTGTIANLFCKQAGYGSVTGIFTQFLDDAQSSYKLVERNMPDGSHKYLWNEDNGGGFIIARLTCVPRSRRG